MEGKSQNILVILIALVIAVAIFSSFGADMISGGIPPITPPPRQTADGGASGGETEDVLPVGVTPETVQNVIATLARPESYYREVTVDYAGTNGAVHSRIWVDGGWTRTDAALPGGLVRRSIVGDGTLYYWYEGRSAWATAPADGGSADLDGPRIPTYEDVLSERREHITAADYVALDGVPCIYVEVEDPELGSSTEYWIGRESGLLTAACRKVGEETVLSMHSSAVERPVPMHTVFALPDGTVLHTSQD